MNNEEHVIVWEAPEIVKPEFRLYYDDNGNVLFYTCEKPDGNYVVIDSQTYAEARPDLRVIDGKVVRISHSLIVSVLHRTTEGTLCEREDISIITDTDGQYWKIKTTTF